MRLHPCFVPWLSVTLHFVWHSSLWSFNSTTTNHSKKSHFCVTSPQSVTGKPIPEPICKHLIHVLFFALFRCAILSSVLCMSMISLQRVLSMRSLDRDYSFFTPKKTLAFVTTLWTILVLYLLLPAFNVWDKPLCCNQVVDHAASFSMAWHLWSRREYNLAITKHLEFQKYLPFVSQNHLWGN